MPSGDPLLIARDIEKTFAGHAVLQGCSLTVRHGERVGIVGANGSGKTTLMSILSRDMDPERGSVTLQGRVGCLTQQPHLVGPTVADAMRHATAWHRQLEAELQDAHERGALDDAASIQAKLDWVGWSIDHKVASVLTRLGCAPVDAQVSRLSGGEARRVSLATVLLKQPDLLLLDEPTNHLDIDAIEWLQATLSGYRGGVAVVTHDRVLLESICTHIVEVEGGRCHPTEGSYADHLIQRTARKARESADRARSNAVLRREAAWAARSPSARSTKQKARLARLEDLQAKAVADAPTLQPFAFTTGVPNGVSLVEAHGLRKAFDDRMLFADVRLTVRPGDRIAILGENGAGKSTLLGILAGTIRPDKGEVLKGQKARIALMNQARTGLDPEDTCFEAVANGNDHVVVRGKAVHVVSFLESFGFDRNHADLKTAALSGGQRARLLLARLMLKGANVLLLDEPTNDLDLSTLRILEEALLGFDGAVVFVAHDRAFVDRVGTRVLAIEDGHCRGYADRQQFLAERSRREAAQVRPQKTRDKARPRAPRTGLTFTERHELEQLPAHIERLETDKVAVEERLGDPETYRNDDVDVSALTRDLERVSREIDDLYRRWEALEAKRALQP